MGQMRPKMEKIVAKLRQVDLLESRPIGSQGGAVDRSGAVHLLTVAQGVRWAEVRPGEALEGVREGERMNGGGRSPSI